jgi:hypothetical protein
MVGGQKGPKDGRDEMRRNAEHRISQAQNIGRLAFDVFEDIGAGPEDDAQVESRLIKVNQAVLSIRG